MSDIHVPILSVARRVRYNLVAIIPDNDRLVKLESCQMIGGTSFAYLHMSEQIYINEKK